MLSAGGQFKPRENPKESALMRSGVAVAAATIAAVVLTACGEQNPASLVFVEVTPTEPRIGDIVTVKFAAVDSRGLPAEGMPVSFSLQSPVPGVEIKPPISSTNKGTGDVTTQLITSARPATVVVVATSGDKVAVSPPISIAGGLISNRGITFQCGHLSGSAAGVHAITAFGAGRDLIAGTTMDCTAHVSDRNGVGIPGASVTFLTEAGTIGPSAQSLTDAVGNADVLHKTSYPLPVDVPPGKFTHINPDPAASVYDSVHIPQPLAPEWMVPWEWRIDPMNSPPPADPRCVTGGGCDEPRRADPIRPGRTNNPRDNLVAMIAITTGEESFIDSNNNGVWDAAGAGGLPERFVDTVEPFVDGNDSGTWEAGELYVDTNGDGSWSGKNGAWDGSTLIWAQERILWTGLPNRYDYQENAPNPLPTGMDGSTYIPTIKQISPAPGSPLLDLGHLGGVTVSYRISDPWFNVFAQNQDGDGCRAEASPAVTVFPSVFGDQGVRLRYPPVIDVAFQVYDVHTGDAMPNPAPVGWAVFPVCTTSSSRRDAFEVNIGLQPIAGTVL